MDHIIYIIISRDRSLTLKIRHTTLPHLRLLWWKRKIWSNFFLPTITCCLPDILHWQSGKVSEMNCDKPNKSLTEQVCKAKKSGAVARLQQEPATNDDDWVAPKFPPFWPLFAAILSTLILTLPPARPPVVRSNKWKVIRLLSPCFFLSHKFDSLFSSFLIYFGALSYLSSLRLPPHQKIPFPSENGNFTIFAAYQSNLRGGEMEMWK